MSDTPMPQRPLRIAISYVRWSTIEQKLGDSKRRQVENTEKFCTENHLVLNKPRVDSGLSAYTGKHRRKGTALSRFLDDVKEGVVPKGAVLIIESLDRLSRQRIREALNLFMSILDSGVDIVTLIDKQWYTKDSINDVQNLMISLISMWRAYEDSHHKGERVGEAWREKREQAIQNNTPMTSVCPGWLKLSADGKRYEPIKARVKKVRLMFWLTLKNWGAQRIAKLFNLHKVPTWGVGDKASAGWHHSYIKKILLNRAVLGEFVPHTYRPEEGAKDEEGAHKRRPIAAPLKDYYPGIIPEAVFQRVQLRRPGPKGPVGRRVSNLFQAMLKDGDFPEFTMVYKDHGDSWQYILSDHRRMNPTEPIFSWQYARLEDLLLNYLQDLDWSGLTVETNAEIRKLTDDLSVAEGRLQEMDGQARRLVALVKTSKGNIKETAAELDALELQRVDLRSRVHILRSEIAAKKGFSVQEGADLVKRLARDRAEFKARLQLRTEIRRYVARIELYRSLPASLVQELKLPKNIRPGLDLSQLLKARCIRILFVNGAERWLVDKDTGVVRFDGVKLPFQKSVVINQDKMGGEVILDASKDNRRQS